MAGLSWTRATTREDIIVPDKDDEEWLIKNLQKETEQARQFADMVRTQEKEYNIYPRGKILECESDPFPYKEYRDYGIRRFLGEDENGLLIHGTKPFINLDNMSPSFLQKFAPEKYQELYGGDDGKAKAAAWLAAEQQRLDLLVLEMSPARMIIQEIADRTHAHRQDDPALD